MTTTATRMPAAERRLAIVEAAIRVFTEGSYRGTTTAEIARAAGVSEPILYRHFASKRDLYLAALDHVWSEARAAWEAALADAEDVRSGLEAVARGHLAVRDCKLQLAELWVQALSESSEDPELRRHLRRHMRDGARLRRRRHPPRPGGRRPRRRPRRRRRSLDVPLRRHPRHDRPPPQPAGRKRNRQHQVRPSRCRSVPNAVDEGDTWGTLGSPADKRRPPAAARGAFSRGAPLLSATETRLCGPAASPFLPPGAPAHPPANLSLASGLVAR